MYEYGRDRIEYEFSMHTVQMPAVRVDGEWKFDRMVTDIAHDTGGYHV